MPGEVLARVSIPGLLRLSVTDMSMILLVSAQLWQPLDSDLPRLLC